MSHSNPTARVHRVLLGLLTLLTLGFWATSALAQSTADIYFIHPDHLNTPRVITNNVNQVVWRWDNLDPFGANLPNENPDGLGIFTCNLRLPGQYFDRETKLHYNYFRDYDPGIGRYIQSDPIGLNGGINTYSYAESNPLSFIDVRGLQAAAPAIPPFPRGAPGRNPSPGFPGLEPKKPEPFFLDPPSGSGSGSSGGSFAWCKLNCDATRYYDHLMCKIRWQLIENNPQLFELCNKGARFKWESCVQRCEETCK
jgi:RHS repeat-associated protein